MSALDHHFGDDSQETNTKMVLGLRTSLVPPVDMKGKYPNGLAAAMKDHPEISQADLARAADTSPQQISKLIQGEREMTALWAEKLAPILQVAPEALVFPGLKQVRVPLLSWASAGRLANEDGIRKSDIRKYMLVPDLPKGEWIVLEVRGDSMDRIAPEGAFICVNTTDKTPANDKFYVFSTPDGGATFKRYRAGKPPRLQPFSTNPDHETLPIVDEMTVLGRVGRVITNLI
jgi:SOS-response transcriptional repressor LexA